MFSFHNAFFPLAETGHTRETSSPQCFGTGCIVSGSLRVETSSVSFQAAINAIRRGGTALVITHPSAVDHQPLRPLTPLDVLSTGELERLDFAYATTLKETCQVLSTIGTSQDPTRPDVIVAELCSMEDYADVYMVGFALALLDNTISFLRRCTQTTIAPFFLAVVDDNKPHRSIDVRASLFPFSAVVTPFLEVRFSSPHIVDLFFTSVLSRHDLAAPQCIASIDYSGSNPLLR